MKLIFTYDKDMDIWCLLNKGKSSNNSSQPTAVYKQLVQFAGENPNRDLTSKFIDKYLKENNIDIQHHIEKYQKEFDSISEKFHEIAQKVFGVSLINDITVYLTINNRCPYNINKNLFFVSVSNTSALRTIMHELWHFYTWYKYGAEEQEKIGDEQYNNFKEALTVLLNVECKDLLPNGVEDTGYPQHQDLRNKIIELWKQNSDIGFVWSQIKSV